MTKRKGRIKESKKKNGMGASGGGAYIDYH